MFGIANPTAWTEVFASVANFSIWELYSAIFRVNFPFTNSRKVVNKLTKPSPIGYKNAINIIPNINVKINIHPSIRDLKILPLNIYKNLYTFIFNSWPHYDVYEYSGKIYLFLL